MTSGLGSPEGLFRLDDSDHFVGSYFSRSDVLAIFEVDDDDLSNLKFKDVGGVEVIDERLLHRAWHKNEILNSTPQKHQSMDELILIAIAKRALDGCSIETQQKVGKFSLDLKITHDGQSVFVEFDGPYHFAMSRYGKPKHHPFRKKKMVEDATGIEVVNWAYWIQRCESNVRALFDHSIAGYGALWGATVHFGDFCFDDSAEIVREINSRFNCIRPHGYGYFYGGNTECRNNPEHPIVEQILARNEKIERLLPNGYVETQTWLPTKLAGVT